MNDQPGQPDPNSPTSNPPTQPLQPEPTHEPTHEHRVLPPDPALQGQGAAPPPRERFVDRLWTLRAVIAVALASVILGGLAGAALASAAGDDGDRRFGPGHGFQRGGPMHPPPGMQRWRKGQDQRQWQQRPRRNGQDGQGPGILPRTPGGPTPSPARPTPSS